MKRLGHAHHLSLVKRAKSSELVARRRGCTCSAFMELCGESTSSYARGNAAEEVLPHWICANRNSKTSTRLSTRPFHSPWSEPAPDPDLLAASIPALRSSRHCGGERIINSLDLPTRRGIWLGRS